MTPSSPHLVFVDLETTGLEPDRHEPWEIAMIVRGHPDPLQDGEWLWQTAPNLARADAVALRLNRFYEREVTAGGAAREMQSPKPASPNTYITDGHVLTNNRAVAHAIARLTNGAHLVGVNPAFDAAFLRAFLRGNGFAESWHYHLVDMLAVAAGRMNEPPPWRSEVLSVTGSVPIPVGEDRHTALGDARWVQRWYDAMFGGEQ